MRCFPLGLCSRAAPILATLVLLGSGTASAGISLSNAVVDFAPKGRPVQDVVVKNHGKKTAYVEVTVRQILNPGKHPEKSEPVDKKDTKLVLSPRKLVIPAGGRKNLRIISRHRATDRDLVYRANVTPILPQRRPRRARLASTSSLRTAFSLSCGQTR